jgi:hypothetical protein
MAADEPGQAGRAGAGGGQGGDAERGDVGPRRAVQGGDVTLDQVCLADMREWQVPWSGQDLDGAGGDPAVPAAGGRVRDRHLMPGQRIQGLEQGFAVLLHRQGELPAALADEPGGGLHRMQGISGHHRVFQVSDRTTHGSPAPPGGILPACGG